MLYEKEWKKALENWQEQRVFLLYSKDEYELRRFSEQTQSRLEKCEQTTAERFPGPAPDLAAVTDAAGMMSFFGTRRVLVLPFVEPQALSDADAALLADLMEQAENSVFVITLFIKDDRTAKSKKCKLILDAAEKNGFCAECAAPQEKDAKQLVVRRAKELSTAISEEAARLLAERCGTDLFLLESETEKLAAACGYTEIRPELVSAMSTVNIEADVFELVNLVESRRMLRNSFSGHQNINERLAAPEVDSPDAKLMARIMKALEANLGNPGLTIEMLASEIGISRVHLHRKLKELTNQTTGDFIRNTRLAMAAKILSEGKQSISEVAMRVGFDNQANFATAFKRMYGMTPREYMNSCASNAAAAASSDAPAASDDAAKAE